MIFNFFAVLFVVEEVTMIIESLSAFHYILLTQCCHRSVNECSHICMCVYCMYVCMMYVCALFVYAGINKYNHNYRYFCS